MDEVFSSMGNSSGWTKQRWANRADAVPDRRSLAHATGQNESFQAG